ncbi:hypothetical protein VHEMI06458 [[Torrubiella] hemipterigena]|uniref:2-oxoadipate dioxygenase/decarboxylase n=1 Tax=[Torrubiella] hemipterigena TaxID=1531966 RepID=A0A0A1TJJ0_9HYPO|nr:hypothetical protein VHEMI06458 [[Torrubiella] hemipterigena]
MATATSDLAQGQHVAASDIRSSFATAMSDMYSQEVPLYDTLLSIVRTVNYTTLEENISLRDSLLATDDLARINLERHGAIRLGTPAELNAVRRVLSVMDMAPIGYYDLSSAGVPVHSTCFRAWDAAELAKNPFRLFVSLLRPELIKEDGLRTEALAILAKREIFSKAMYALLAVYESNGGFTAHEAADFVAEAIEAFRWRSRASVSHSQYQLLLQESPVLADIVAFQSPHINHLTPRTLDIDAVQAAMRAQQIPLKHHIEGPPKRQVPILLRQTSFNAIEEKIEFPDGPGLGGCDKTITAGHTARFGEIEQRGAALTVKGRQLYDRLLASAIKAGITSAEGPEFSQIFADFPDSVVEMQKQDLAWFQYRISEDAKSKRPESDDLPYLIRNGFVVFEPIVYEDFLPVSAAGIFQSNLSTSEPSSTPVSPHMEDGKELFERALGSSVADEMALYKRIQEDTVLACQKWARLARAE